MSNILIRPVRIGDAERIWEIGLQEDVMPYVLFTPSRTRTSSSRRWTGVSWGIIGMNVFTGRRSHIGYLYLFVDTEFHGQGVGTEMLKKVIDLSDNWLVC